MLEIAAPVPLLDTAPVEEISDYWKRLQITEQITGLRVAVADARGQFGNPEEKERPPLEAVISERTGETADREDSLLAAVNCRVCRSVNRVY
jgi:hypothetical protein